MAAHIEQLKAIPILDVAARLGLQVKGNRMHCINPHHVDKKTPSLHFNVAENYFNCFGCELGGSTIELVMAATGSSFKQAINWLEQEYGFSGYRYKARRSKARPRSKSTDPKEIPTKSTLKPDPEVYHWLISNSPLPEVGLQYLLSRGLSPETITHFRLGGSLKPRSLIQSAEQHFGTTRLQKAGLLAKSKTKDRLWPVWWESIIIIPFFWKNDSPIYLQARRVDSSERRKYIGLSGVAKPIFNAQIINELNSGDRIYIVEGAMDAMAAYESGLNAIGILGAKTKFKRSWALALQKFCPIVVPDQDRSGDQFKDHVVAAFAEIGKSIDVQYLPKQYGDLADTLGAIKKGKL